MWPFWGSSLPSVLRDWALIWTKCHPSFLTLTYWPTKTTCRYAGGRLNLNATIDVPSHCLESPLFCISPGLFLCSRAYIIYSSRLKRSLITISEWASNKTISKAWFTAGGKARNFLKDDKEELKMSEQRTVTLGRCVINSSSLNPIGCGVPVARWAFIIFATNDNSLSIT